MKNRRKKQNIQKSYACKIFGLIVAITVIAVSGGVLLKRTITESPEDTLVEYMNHIEKKEYEVMYTMIDSDEKVYLTKEEYIQRNSKIYEGIEVSDIKISHIAVKEKKADTVTLSYETSCNTIAGNCTPRPFTCIRDQFYIYSQSTGHRKRYTVFSASGSLGIYKNKFTILLRQPMKRYHYHFCRCTNANREL